MRLFVVAVGMLILAMFAELAFADRAGEHVRLTEQYEAALEETSEGFLRQRKRLFEQYAKAVERIQENFQRAGDLENALLAKEEAELARTKQENGNEHFPRVEPLRRTLGSRLDQIEINASKAETALAEKVVAALEPMRLEFTRSGMLEEASAVDEHLRELEERISLLEDRAGMGPTRESGPELQRIEQSVLGQAKPLTGGHKLQPGIHDNIGRTVLGDRSGEEREDQEASLTVPYRCILENGEIFVDIAEFEAQDSIFRDIEFTQNLHSEFRAAGCLFDDCTFAKGGGWGARVSSRWIFSDCVFRKSFFRDWRQRTVGVQATRCTFESVDIEPFEYLEDAGAEAVHAWWVFERCHFRNDSVPVSVLLATRNCVVENCRIERDRFPIDTRISVTLYYKGIEPEIPDLDEHVTIKLEPVEKLGGKFGAQVDYRVTRDGLAFED